jgi:hypothetical protein
MVSFVSFIAIDPAPEQNNLCNNNGMTGVHGDNLGICKKRQIFAFRTFLYAMAWLVLSCYSDLV